LRPCAGGAHGQDFIIIHGVWSSQLEVRDSRLS
jgi:hypothetical protein